MQIAVRRSTTCSIIFTMRYPDNTGYVWDTIAQSRDAAASNLNSLIRCFIAYPTLTDNPTYHPKHMESVELDCYDYSEYGLNKIVSFVKEHNVKIIVFMSALPTTVNLGMLRRLGVRTINTENDGFDHTRRDPFLKRVVKFVARKLFRRQLHDMHLANAEAQFHFLSTYAMVPHSRLSVVRDGVDCSRFTPDNKYTARESLGIAAERYWIIAVAQARPEKRINLIINAAKQVIDARPNKNIGFLFVGDGPTLKESQKMAEDLCLGDRFVFAGHQKDLVTYYQAANLMVHASTRESFGLAIVEAMSCGIPVVASAAAGPRETIIDGKTGAIIAINDDIGFVDAILRYVDDESLTLIHGSNARAHVSKIYGLDRHGREIADHIGALL